MTTKEIQMLVGKEMVLRGHSCVCENVSNFIPYREMDVMSVSKSGYLYEFEVKVSRSDFMADFKKKNRQFNDGINGVVVPRLSPNFFSYVCPDGMIVENEIPSYAGLYYASINGLKTIRKPTIIHKEKRALADIQQKLMRIYEQRHFLGDCLLTYLNKQIKLRNTKANQI